MIAFGKKYIVGITHIFCTNAFPTQKRKPTFLTHLAVFLASLAKCTFGKDANLHTRWRCIKAKIKKCKNANLALLAKMKDCVFSISFIWHTSVHGVGLLQCTKIFGSLHPCHSVTQCDTVWHCHTRLLSQLVDGGELSTAPGFTLSGRKTCRGSS